MTSVGRERIEAPFPLIRIAGEPAERGFQYGARARGEIDLALDFYRRRLALARDLTWGEVTAIARRFRAMIAAYDAQVLAEMEGIADGAHRSIDDIVALNIRTELLAGLRAECTTMAVLPPATATGHTLIAANWDYYPEIAGACVLLAVQQPGRPSLLMFVEAGMIAKMGLNSAGLGLCQNGLSVGLPRLGVPYYAVLRRALEATNLDDAVSGVLAAERSFSANFMIAHAQGDAADVEAAPSACAVLLPDEGTLCHTNHCLADLLQPIDAGPRWLPDSPVRAARVAEQLRALRGRVTTGALRETLRDHANWPNAICRHPNERQPMAERMQTITSVIIDLSERVMYLTNGPPCENAHHPVPLAAVLGEAPPAPAHLGPHARESGVHER